MPPSRAKFKTDNEVVWGNPVWGKMAQKEPVSCSNFAAIEVESETVIESC
jgi:hypothetical protein